ncbi:MAG: hypothetical protein J5525_10710 [Lachnospiraceae bacterium]|nr:hypothetical protein [Lachnospiraceae bacterium]
MENKKEEDFPVIELKSEEVQELMDKKPSCVLRYGIGVVLLLLGCSFVASKFVPYPDELKVIVTLSPNVNTKKFVNTRDVEVLYIIPYLKSNVCSGDTLGVFAYENDTITYVSPYNGMAYISGGYNCGDFIKSGNLTILVSDCEIRTSTIYARSFVDVESAKKIRCGMIMTTEENKDIYVVKELSSIPDENGFYTIVYKKDSKQSKIIMTQQETIGYITLDDSNVYDRFFAQGIKNIIKL